MLYGNFDTTGDCVWCGDNPGDVAFPESFTGRFSKRYKLVDGEVVDKYPGKSDAEAEQLWLAEVYVDPNA